MQDLHSLDDPKVLHNLYIEGPEPSVSYVSTDIVTQILAAKYEKVKLPAVVDNNCKHLNIDQQNKLPVLLIQYEELFNGTLGNWKGDVVNFNLKPDGKPFYGQPFPVPYVHKDTIKRKLQD